MTRSEPHKPPRVVAVLPSIDDDLPESVKDALAIRNAANVEGRCPACGATPRLIAGSVGPGQVAHVAFEHEPDCPVVADGELDGAA